MKKIKIIFGIAFLLTIIIIPKSLLFFYSESAQPWIGTIIALTLLFIVFPLVLILFLSHPKTVLTRNTNKKLPDKLNLYLKIVLILIILISACSSLKSFSKDLFMTTWKQNELLTFNGKVNSNNLRARNLILNSQRLEIVIKRTGEKEFYTSYFLPEIQEDKEYTFYILPHSELIVWFEPVN